MASHGYVAGKEDLSLVEATHTGEKSDLTKRRKGKVVWPSSDQLEEAPEIGYGHFL